MSFIKQITGEMKNLLRSKFILITAIVILALSAFNPVMTAVLSNSTGNSGTIMPMMEMSMEYAYPGEYYGDPIVVDGVTIEPDNPFYGEIQYMQDEMGYVYDWMSSTAAADYANEVLQVYLDYYVKYAQVITSYEDYRNNLVWDGTSYIGEKYLLEASAPADMEAFLEGISVRIYVDGDIQEDYLGLPEAEKAEKLAEVDASLAEIDDVIVSNDFIKYADMMIAQQYDQIDTIEKSIEELEQNIVENPDLEEQMSFQIEDMKMQIELILDNHIPIWEYRKEKGIIPGDGSWQNEAISQLEYNRNNLSYDKILSEEDFREDQYLVDEYSGNYQAYVADKETVRAGYEREILIAQNSLDADKPDMKFVPNEARNAVNSSLGYALLVAFLGVLVGGWAIASEFQLGTVRLLMIRPRTRSKILISKFLAGLKLTYIVYILGFIINLLLNGIILGFDDFANPNFTPTGEVSFFSMIIGRMFASSVTLVFSYSIAFMVSVLVKNIAVAIVVPGVLLLGNTIFAGVMSIFSSSDWLAYTPIPYVNIADFFSDYSTIYFMKQQGVDLQLSVGIIMLLAISVVAFIISFIKFKRQDITN